MILNDEDADPKGYFTGTATLNGTEYSDMTALVYGNRILLFSPTANVQYDMAITPTLDAYTGTVEVYVDGVIKQVSTVTVSGTVSGTTNELQITGTFADGTGFADGSFDVAFDAANNVGATLARIERVNYKWTGNVYGYDKDTGFFKILSQGRYVGGDSNIELCAYPNTTIAKLAIPDSETNIYQLSHPIEKQAYFGTCSPPYESTGHTGFAAVVDDVGIDDKLVFAFNNGDIAVFAVMAPL